MRLSLRILQDTWMSVQQGWASISMRVGNASCLLCYTWEWGGRLQPSFMEPKTLFLSDARGSAVAWRLVQGMLLLKRMGGSCTVSWIVRCVFWGHRLQSPNCGSLGQDHKKIRSQIFKMRFSRHVLPLVAPCVGNFSTFDTKTPCCLSSWTQTWPHHPNSNLICLPVLSLLQSHPADGGTSFS